MKTKLLCTSKKALFILGLLVTSLNAAFAQSPANDYCGSAASLSVYGATCGGSVTGNLANATQSAPPILCNAFTGTSDDDVWYKFVATSTSHIITVVGSSGLDAVVELVAGACGTNLDCADATLTGGTETLTATALTVGTTYYIRIYSFGASVPSTTTFTICITTPAPANNNCSGAISLTVFGSTCGGATTGNVAGATQSITAAPCSGTADDDVWYSFIATSTSHTITVAGSANFDAVVNLRDGTCSGPSMNCSDNSGNGGTEVINATNLIVGNTYFVRAYHYWASLPSTTTFTICITTPPPANDNCSGATSLTVFGATCGGATTGNVAGSTLSLAATCAGTADDDVWYKFVATSPLQIITVVGSTSFDAVVDLRSGACSGSNVSCADATVSGGTEVINATGLTIGNTYYVRVYSWSSAPSATSTFTICVTTPTPVNDDCSGATSLIVYGTTCGGSVTGNTSGATQSIPATCVGTADDDIWYSFVATSASHIITVAGSTNFDAVIDLRSGSCSGTNVSCSDATGGGGTEALTATGLVAGSTYYVRVYHYFATVPSTTTFTICVTTPAPINDNCSGASPLTVYGTTCGASTTGNVAGATQSLAATCAGTANDDIWYSFVATAAAHDITVVGSASFDAVIDLRSGSCNGTNISCKDATTGAGTELLNATGLTIGNTYYVRVYDYYSSVPTTTTFTICITTPTPPPPANDECAASVLLTVYGATCGGATTGNVTGATQSIAPISCGNFTSSAANDVWYSFVASSASQIITVVGSSSFDAIVDLRSGACTGTNVSCADATGTSGTEVINATGLTVGSTYFVRVYNYGGTLPAVPTFTICITTPAPANDNCSGAASLTVYGATCGAATTGNVASATQSIAAITCNGATGTANDDVWYSFVATAIAHDITVVGSATFDAVIDLRTGSCNGTNVSCADATFAAGTEVINATALTVGTTYYVRVYHYGSAIPANTTFTICVTTPVPPPPANDNCSGATALTVYGATCGAATTGNVAGATLSIPALTCNAFTGTADDDIWYSFVATSTTHNITVVGSANFDAIIDLRSGACTGTNINCADATSSGGTELLAATGLTIGTTYFVRIYSYGSSVPATTTFTICITTPAPVNNDCSGATSLTVYGTTCGGATTGNVFGATQSLAATCAGTADDDIWYSFVATGASHIITVVGSTGFDAVIDLRSGACNGTNISCLDATTSGGTETLTATGLVAGTTYYVRVYHYYSTVPTTTTFTICVTTPAPPTPSNDECAGATSLTVYGTSCGGATTGNVAAATQSLPSITCNGSTGTANDDVWYSFVATATSHNVTVVGSANFDAVVDLRSGACNGTNINCADSSFGGGTEVVIATGLTIGNTYFVRVYDYGSSTPTTTTFTICVTTPTTPPPANNNCAGATTLTVHGLTCTASTAGDVAGATQSIAAISCNGSTGTANDDVWYKFTATSTTHDITVVGSSSLNAVVDMHALTCSGANVNCADATGNGGTEVINATGLTIGTLYFVRVYDFASTVPLTTTFTICVTTPGISVPANDTCSKATSLVVYGAACGGATTGTVAGASQSLAALPCTGTAEDDVWYTFVATSSTHDITVVGSTSFNAVMDLRSGACNGTNITCKDATTAGGTEVINATGLTVGTTYYVRVYDFGATAPATTTFTICVTTPTPSTPANDDCAGATSLTVYSATCGGATTGNVVGATQSLPAILCSGFTGTANDDVWYSFVANSTSHIITVVGSTSFDAVIDLRSGACSGTNINCADTSFGGGTEILNANGLTVGNTYYVRVYHYSSSVPATTTFTICITTPTPPVPANDNCSGAVSLTVYGATCGGATTGSVASATLSSAAITCNSLTGTADDDVWYSFVATATSHNVTVVGSTNLNAVVEILSGVCPGVNVNCADATIAGGTELINATGLTIGSTYFVRVYDFGSTTPATTSFTICVTTPSSSNPPNDLCANPTALTVFGTTCGGATTGDVSGATQSAAPITCNGLTGTTANDVWYSFVATATSHNITVTGSANFDAVIDLSTSGCSGTNIDCSNSSLAAGTEVINSTGLTIGTTYFVRVYHFGTVPTSTTFTICITTPSTSAPVNDDCSGATSLTVFGLTCGGATTGDITGATQSLPAITCGGSTGTADDDLWYSFVATDTTHIITLAGSASFDAVLDLRTGTCTGTNLSCTDATFTGGTEVMTATSLIVGSTYFVRVYHYGSTVPATTTFTICVTTPGPPPSAPPNDNCAGAVLLTAYGATCGGTTTGDVAGATQSLAATCGGTANDDVWYSFVATATAHHITVVGSASFDAVIDVLSGACTGTNISCGDTSFTGGTEVLNATGLTVGDTYLVRVYHYSSSIPATTTFSICITTPCAAPNTTVTPASATICNGNSTTLTANGANSYSWLPTTGLSSSTSAIVTANPTTTTTYTVTGTFNGCSGTQVVTVTVDPAATANITQIENLLTSTPGTAYQWYLNGIIIPGATSQSHLASQNGNYTVTTTNATGCEATSNPFPIISFLGISKNDGTNVITIYPNPFNTSATLEIKGAVGNGNVALVVYDMVGREVKNIPLSNSQSNTTQSGVSFTIDRNELSNGMYFYKVSNEDGVIGSGKFSIQ
ncbi:MAG: T9SS type A sorting domain-containing protein [Bacteroidia bacterium]|nr:T9SS type A sorting domain-containing protein [Bacteroidia bacterium]